MAIQFYKYQGTGNDFVMIDNRRLNFDKNNTKLVAKMCDRRFGIGADGLILLENHDTADFKMVYYNADGNQSSMCGNGGRCLVAFAKHLGIISNTAIFEAVDGMHHASIKDHLVELQMQDVPAVKANKAYVFLNTGSPHHVQLVSDLTEFKVKEEGAKIRYGSLYGNEGSNVNFVTKESEDTFRLRTYERGVEDETLSCGTGATAVALAMHHIGETEHTLLNLQVEGGQVQVSFNKTATGYKNIWLIGPAEQVFTGEW
ncbi:MAG: diaminopimelate epimerase [Algicola sp.]|nr:diaminopimelate epimerase [Algicola sp.]